MSVDLGAAYRAARLRIAELVSDDVGELAVAATPEWNLHDVVAHVTGIVDDATSGNMDGAPGDAWTAAQVLRGQGRTVAEMVSVWHEKAPLVEMTLSSPDGASRANAVFDIHTHECDLLTALGRPITVPTDVLAWIAGSFRESFAATVAEAGLPPVAVELSRRRTVPVAPRSTHRRRGAGLRLVDRSRAVPRALVRVRCGGALTR